MENLSVVVLGASDKPQRYSYRALKLLLEKGYRVYPVHPRLREIDGIRVYLRISEIGEPVDTVTLYVGPQNQPDFYDYVEKIKPRRVIFNPGTENKVFADRLKASGIETEEACTLVLLGIGAY